MPKIRLWIDISPLPSKVKTFPLGCAKCRLMEVAAHTAVEESGADAEVIKIQDTILVREHRAMAQPALFIHGVLEVGREDAKRGRDKGNAE